VKGSFALLAVSAAVIGSALIAVPVIARTADGADTSAAKEKQKKVRVMDNFFDPRSIGVLEDEKVSFVWKGSNRHNVRFTKVPAGASRKGSKIKRAGRWTRGFGKPGLYRYVCTLFSGMRGTISVNPPPAEG
jgi:plastocyanin